MRCACARHKVGYPAPVFPHTAVVPHPCCRLAKCSDTFSQCRLQDIIISTSSPLTHFHVVHESVLGDRVFYTCSNGVGVPAQVVETSRECFAQLEYYQDAVKVENGHPISISFAIPSSHSPPLYSPSPRSRSGGWFSGWSWESYLTIGCYAHYARACSGLSFNSLFGVIPALH